MHNILRNSAKILSKNDDNFFNSLGYKNTKPRRKKTYVVFAINL